MVTKNFVKGYVMENDIALKVFRLCVDKFLVTDKINNTKEESKKKVRIENGIDIEIACLLDDEKLIEAINKFELYKLENIVKFFVDMHFTAIDSIHNSILELYKARFRDIIAETRGIHSNIDVVLQNNSGDRNKLWTEVRELNKLNEKLKLEIIATIDNLAKIDNQNKYQFFLTSAFNLKKVDLCTNIIRISLDFFIRILNTQILIGNILGLQMNNIIEGNIDFLRQAILVNDHYALLNAYDKDKSDGYWKNIPVTIKKLTNLNQELLTLNYE